MKYFDLSASYPDSTIAAAWDSQIKEADKTSWLAEKLATRESELFARFAACYEDLRALPRNARRALQRRIACSSELAAILPEYLQQDGRRLQHRMALSLAGAALLLALAQGVGTAATITVSTNNPNIASDGQCSLIEAIVNANNDAKTHADCTAGNGADTIMLPANANVILSSIDNSALGPTGLPMITSQIVIEGNGATIARQGNAPAFRVMAVRDPGNLTLQNVTLSGGSSFGDGGGVLNGGFSSGVCCGGGLHPGGTLTIKNSIISGNTANSFGGGIFDYSGTLTIENSTISLNTAAAGGGVFMSYSTVVIKNSTIWSNAAIDGGGVYNAPGAYGFGGGRLTINNSTVSGNGATNNGGGIASYSVTINNSTISGNTAINSGGGVYNSLYCFYCSNGGVLTLNDSLIAGNQATVGAEIANINGSLVDANNFNLFGTNGNAGVTGFTPGQTDIVPAPGVSLPQILGPLQNNGGPTQTHALVAGSPAIDAGDPSGCRDSLGAILTIDQRGFARQFDGDHNGTSRCDIGAYELGSILVASSETFVRQQYLDFLDRAPESAGLSGWVNALDAGLPRASLIERFMDSGEFFFKGKFIAQIYLGLLTRDADFSGFRGWLEVLLTGVSHEQIVEWFLDSAEFTIRFGSSLTNSQFIERMYNNVLLRSTAPGEFNFWVEQLTTGQMTRAQVALGILDSDEFQNLGASQNRVDISLLYFDMLRRDPDPGGFSGWVGVLNSGVPLISVIDGFLNSTEYQTGF